MTIIDITNEKNIKNIKPDSYIISYTRNDNGEIIENKFFKEYDSKNKKIKVGYKINDHRGYYVNINNISNLDIDHNIDQSIQNISNDKHNIDPKITISKDKHKINTIIDHDIPKKQYTLEEQEQALKNSISVDENEWDTLELGTRLSYYKKDGSFTKNIYYDHFFTKNVDGEKISYLLLSNNKSFANTYSIRTSLILKLFKYIDTSNIRIVNLMTMVENLREYIHELEIKIQDNDDKYDKKYNKLLALIKKLHPNRFE